jgi:hypothetical protein
MEWQVDKMFEHQSHEIFTLLETVKLTSIVMNQSFDEMPS